MSSLLYRSAIHGRLTFFDTETPHDILTRVTTDICREAYAFCPKYKKRAERPINEDNSPRRESSQTEAQMTSVASRLEKLRATQLSCKGWLDEADSNGEAGHADGGKGTCETCRGRDKRTISQLSK